MESSRQLVPANPRIGRGDQGEPNSDAEDATGERMTPSEARALWGEPRRRLIAIALALFTVAFAISAPIAARVHGISVFDEPNHADYAYQLAHGHIPARGSYVAPEIQTELFCRGSAWVPNAPRPRCGQISPSTPRTGSHGQTYVFGHPPLYYAITGVLARAAGVPFAGSHFILFARLVGVLWLFAAMLILYVALRRFAVGWPIAAAAATMLAATPAIFYPAATVTNDAAAALAGSLAVLALARITVEGRLGWKLPAVLALLAAATKILNAMPFLAIAAVVLVLALREWRVDRERALGLLRIAVGIVGGVLVVYVGWTVFQDHRGVAHWVNPIAGRSSRPVSGLPFDELLSTSFTSIALLSTGSLPPVLVNTWLTILLRVWGPLGIAAMGAVLAVHRTWTPRFTLAACTVIGVIAVPWVVELQVYTTGGEYFPAVVSRYAASFIALVLASMAMAADDRRLVKSLLGFAGVCVAVGLCTAVRAA